MLEPQKRPPRSFNISVSPCLPPSPPSLLLPLPLATHVHAHAYLCVHVCVYAPRSLFQDRSGRTRKLQQNQVFTGSLAPLLTTVPQNLAPGADNPCFPNALQGCPETTRPKAGCSTPVCLSSAKLSFPDLSLPVCKMRGVGPAQTFDNTTAPTSSAFSAFISALGAGLLVFVLQTVSYPNRQQEPLKANKERMRKEGSGQRNLAFSPWKPGGQREASLRPISHQV